MITILRSRLCWAALLLVSPQLVNADVAAGVDWLAARDGVGGVHAAADIGSAADTNAAAWTTVNALGVPSRFPGLRAAAQAVDDGSLATMARRVIVRLDQGLASDEVVEDLLSHQASDGGFPSHAGHRSEPEATAWVVAALDRAGRGSQTPAQRALGFLLARQLDGGGWGVRPGEPASVYASSIVAAALQRFAGRYSLESPLARVQAFLLAAGQSSGGFGETFAAASALDALLLLRTPHEQLQPAILQLAARQLADGSYGGDAFTTALALRALWRWEQPAQPGNFAGLRGRVLAAHSELPITGATLHLSGPDSLVIATNNAGELRHDALPGGAWSGQLDYPGMSSVAFELSLVDGRILDLGDIRMFQGSAGSPVFGMIRGVVTASDTGLPIPGAQVALEDPPSTVVADADGRYQFLQVPAGQIHIHATAAGYSSVSTQLTVQAGSLVELSVHLTPRETPLAGARVQGRVSQGPEGNPLVGATVAVVSGAQPASTQTAADGSYVLDVEPEGLVIVAASHQGLETVEIKSQLVPDQILAFSPTLYPAGAAPPGANTTSVRGMVVNQANRAPLANALIVVTDPAGQQSLRSASDGSFQIQGLAGPTVGIAFSADAFDPVNLLVPVLPLELRDIGTVGLKPTAMDYYLADLRVVSSSLSTTDPDRFGLAAAFDVGIANSGSSAVVQDFDLVAFVDGNGDGIHDPAIEPEAGRMRVTDDLAIGGTTMVSIAATAQLAYRDAPIAFMVDAGSEVPEVHEQNNTGSSLLGCRVTPAFIGSDTVHEAWRWEGLASDPSVNSMNQTPVVGQLTDDNGDGAINAYDVPDIVFVAGRRSSSTPGKTALVAISGDNGREHWARTDIRLSHFSGLALGDIDNDGIAEIVGVRNYREELVAFENDGSLKWRTPLHGPGMPEVLIPPPPYVYDQPIIVNLEGDNEAEVVFGREAFRGITGARLWTGAFDAGGDAGKPASAELTVAFSVASIAADINLDGVMEVVAGRTAYNADGIALWHRGDIKPVSGADTGGTPTNASGMNAIGNFDLDDYPEIVLAIDDELWLLEHTGETVFGPVHAPDFGDMGAPSVADVDDDGLPEILISSNQRLTLFETDGTVKWTATISDGSGVTSATVFDFENDGLYEVVHVDEEDFRIFDALTGARLYETRHTSRTVYEVPVVADIDGDREAEVLLTGFDDDLVAGTTPGLRVFEARNGAWADAGSVWGSQAFHIDELAEDGTVPLLETPSWLTHNSYRVQRSPLPDPMGLPDFTLGALQLLVTGPGSDPVVRVRAGNAGPVDAHEPPWLGVYRGDPGAGGVLLAEVRLDSLRAGRSQLVDLPGIALEGNGELVAVIDSRQQARECREGNNRRAIPFAAANGEGTLSLATDAPSYAPGTIARFTATVLNSGAVAADFTVHLQVLNGDDEVVHSFAPQAMPSLAGGQGDALEATWNTGDVLGGTYQLSGTLLDGTGRTVDAASVAFAVAGNSSGLAGSMSLSTRQYAYRPEQVAVASLVASNTSDDTVIHAPQITMTVRDGAGGTVFQQSWFPDDLFPGARYPVDVAIVGADQPGTYAMEAVLQSNLTGNVLAGASGQFVRLSDASAGLTGAVQLTREELIPGEPQSCVVSVRNVGSTTYSALPARTRLVAEASGDTAWEEIQAVDLAAGGSWNDVYAMPTANLLPGLHVCVLEVPHDQAWRILDAAAFEVLGQPAAGIDVAPQTGLVTNEAGRSEQFMVSLRSRPAAEVSVAITPSDASEWTTEPGVVRFTPGSWDVPRIVTVHGVDDAIVDGDQPGTILVGPAASADPAYDGIDAPDVQVLNLDDDAATILVAPPAVVTSETGTIATFSVSLTSAPTAPVTIAIQNPDPSEWSLSADAVRFDTHDWEVTRVVEVQGLDDHRIDGGRTGTIALLPASSADPQYAGADAEDVLATNLDDDSAAVQVEPVRVVTREGGSPAAFTVRLSSEPYAPVSIALGPVDSSEWFVEALEVVLHAGNWQDGAVVPVVPIDDDQRDGDQQQQLGLGPAQSTDPAYLGLHAPPVELLNLDDDGPRIVVLPDQGLVVDERGTQAIFTVALTEAPQGPVRIAVRSLDQTEFQVDTIELLYEPTDWGTRTVVVTGVDDPEVDGNVAGLVELGPAHSTDPGYHGQDPRDVVVSNVDDEQVQIHVAPTILLTDEGGASAGFAVRLNSAPTARVSIELGLPDPTEWQVAASSIVFDVNDWDESRVVSVLGLDDALDDGDAVGTIVLAAAASDDPRFAGIDPVDVAVVNLDDESAGGSPLPPAVRPRPVPIVPLWALVLLISAILSGAAGRLRRQSRERFQ